MSKAAYGTILLFITVFAFTFPTSVFAKPAPVPGIIGMFDEFNELEEKIRADEWAQAKTAVSEIESQYKKLVGDLKGTVDSKTIQKFGFFIGNLKKNIAKKDAEGVEKPYMTLQGLFLDIMDNYNYPSPPVLIIIARYLGETEEGLAENNFKEAAGELEEISKFKPRAEKAFTEKGASKDQINIFFSKIQKAEKAVESKNSADAKSLVEELKNIISAYVKVEDDD